MEGVKVLREKHTEVLKRVFSFQKKKPKNQKLVFLFGVLSDTLSLKNTTLQENIKLDI